MEDTVVSYFTNLFSYVPCSYSYDGLPRSFPTFNEDMLEDLAMPIKEEEVRAGLFGAGATRLEEEKAKKQDEEADLRRCRKGWSYAIDTAATTEGAGAAQSTRGDGVGGDDAGFDGGRGWWQC
ncbi:hypothetical protein LWI29_019673 [Acer saccharum]|uniref:Uncharacterized protein n=1 Tax=Acer saccharum TaxID=4024 RepID=A0AA39VR22_ACESA|nr:hypothetical protein LWI29_019673 [Acer saccharum]